MYYEFDDYFEPGEFDEKIEELKNELISLFANSIDILRKIDTEYDSYANEFGLGRKRIFVAPEMLTDENGNKVFDENDTVFYSLPEETLKDTNPRCRRQIITGTEEIRTSR